MDDQNLSQDFVIGRITSIKQDMEIEKAQHADKMNKYKNELQQLQKISKILGISPVINLLKKREKWTENVLKCIKTNDRPMKTVEIAEYIIPDYKVLTKKEQIKYNTKISYALSKLAKRGILNTGNFTGDRGYSWILNPDIPVHNRPSRKSEDISSERLVIEHGEGEDTYYNHKLLPDKNDEPLIN